MSAFYVNFHVHDAELTDIEPRTGGEEFAWVTITEWTQARAKSSGERDIKYQVHLYFDDAADIDRFTDALSVLKEKMEIQKAWERLTCQKA